MSVSLELRPFVPQSYMDDAGNLTVTEEQATQVAQQIKNYVEALPPAEQMVYLTMLDSPDFAPTANATDSDISAALDRLHGAATRMIAVSEFLSLAEDVNALARLLLQATENARESELQQRLNARSEAKAELTAQAASQRSAAEALKSNAVFALVLGVVGGALNVLMSGIQGFSAGRTMARLKELKAPELKSVNNAGNTGSSSNVGQPGAKDARVRFSADEKAFEKALKEVEQKAQKVAAFGQGAGGVASISQAASAYFNNIGQAESQRLQADGSENAAQAQETGSIADMRKEMQSALEDLIRSLISLFKEMGASEAEAMQSVTRV